MTLPNRRTGFSMLEVMAVLVVISSAALAASMLAPVNATRSLESASESRRLLAALHSARQTAVMGGMPVQVRFNQNASGITDYTVERDSGGGKFTPLLPTSSIANLPVRTSNANSILFQPTGAASTSLLVQFGNGKQTHQVTVVSGTGLARYTKK